MGDSSLISGKVGTELRRSKRLSCLYTGRIARWVFWAAFVCGWFGGEVFVFAEQPEKTQRSLANQGDIALGREDRQDIPQQRLAAQPPLEPEELQVPSTLDVDKMLSPGGLTSTLKLMLLLTVLSLAPAILMMTTCFIRFVIVLGLLRQALGTQQLPPNQVIISLCLFLTFLVMAPVWQKSYEEGIHPYTHPQPGQAAPDFQTAFENTVRPVRRFMSDQIERTGNSEAVWTFLDFQRPPSESKAAQEWEDPETYEEIPLSVLLPAFVLSEMKTAFLIGFQIYLPFVVIDMVISSVLISMGMMMLPPVLISLPFKLLLFVMIDGWFLTVGMMLESVRPFG